jgi:hypothetical protein
MNEQQLAAVKQALEALLINCGGNTEGIGKEAITALQSIIAQHALDKKAENARELGLSYDYVSFPLGVTRPTAEEVTRKPARQDVPETNFGNMAEPKIGCVNHDCDQCKAVQEPVLWGVRFADGSFSLYAHVEQKDAERIAANSHPGTHAAPLYAAPPAPQPVPVKTYHDGKPWPVAPKPWVGLTNDEVNNFAAGCHLGNSVQDAIYKAEAKLREKNGGAA